MKKKIIIWIIFIVVIGGFISYRAANKNKAKVLQVKIVAAVQGEVKSYLSTTGTIKSKNSKDYFPLQGKAKKVNVKIGDTVNKGAILVEYEVADANVAVKQAQIQYDNAVLSKKMLTNNNNDIKNQIIDLDKQIAEAESSSDPRILANAPALKERRKALKPISDEQFKQSDNAIALAKIALTMLSKIFQRAKIRLWLKLTE
jgi:HlyD family secretion protein